MGQFQENFQIDRIEGWKDGWIGRKKNTQIHRTLPTIVVDPKKML